MKNFLLTVVAVMLVTTTSSNAGAAIEYSNRDLECMAKNIYFEARGESERGKLMIAEVTLNRLNNSRFPNTICGVVYEKMQFDWTRRNRPIRDKAEYSEAKRLAEDVLDGKVRLSETGALYFKSVGSRSNFHSSRPHVTTVGNHEFFR